jgi:hypothetical protein
MQFFGILKKNVCTMMCDKTVEVYYVYIFDFRSLRKKTIRKSQNSNKKQQKSYIYRMVASRYDKGNDGE